MSKPSEFEEESAKRKAPRTRGVCRAVTVVEDLTPEQAEQYRSALADKAISSRVIVDVLHRWGVTMASEGPKNHRGGRCCCVRAQA